MIPAWRNSLTWRIGMLYALASFVLLAAVGAFLYRSIVAHMKEHNESELLGRVAQVRHVLSEAESASDVQTNSHRVFDILIGHHGFELTLTDRQGKVLLSSSPLPGLAPGPVLDLTTAADAPADTLSWDLPDGRAFRVFKGWVHLKEGAGEPVLIAAVLDVTDRTQLLAHYRHNVIVAVLLGTILASALGYGIARQGLNPLRDITDSTSRITASRLDQRLDTGSAPAELRELVESFNAMLDRLGDSFSRLAEFSSDLAHDLRTPIANLLGEAQVTLSRPRSNAEYCAVLESNVEELERIARMLDSMLFLARADRAQTALQRESIDLRKELEKIREYFQTIANLNSVEIAVAGEGLLFADVSLVRRAINNLVANALRYTPPGGTVSMKFHRGENSDVIISVANPGPGIPAQHLARVFDRFYRADTARTGSSRGSGLGLAIVKSIMQLHRGDVSVTSIPDGITTFTLRFPQDEQLI